MMISGVLLTVCFWTLLLPLVKRQDPSLDRRLSLTGFWEDKQRALDLGLLIYHDASFIGYLGDRAWTEKVIQWVINEKEPLLGHGVNPVHSLPYLTNHKFPREVDPALAWAEWWKGHHSQTQEQWIQEGFKLHGFDISLPPNQKDWPKLLSLLGATAGPFDFDPTMLIEMHYPEYLRYNAYRWLRDSGFEPIRYFADHAHQQMSGDESGGLIVYQEQKAQFEEIICPLPGKLASADQEWWGVLGLDGGIHLPELVHPVVQTVVTLVFVALFSLGYFLACARRTDASPKPKSPEYTIKRRTFGWLFLTAGAFGAVNYWLFLVPWLQGKAPDYTPHLSAQGFWESKQTHLKWGPWWHEDGNLVGLFGDREWAARIIEWIASGKDIESCQAGHRDSALPLLTNQEFDLSDSGQAWQRWWHKNEAKTQEQWIQEGFKKQGFDIALPPTEKDWPQLLTLLGSTAGSSPAKWEEEKSTPPSMLHPFYARYNAYRWLRDSGFEPVLYALAHRSQMSGDERGGLLEYQAHVLDMQRFFESQVPGRLAFAPKEGSGWVDPFTFEQSPTLLQTRFQLAFTSCCAILGLIGWGIMRPRTLRNGRPDAVTP